MLQDSNERWKRQGFQIPPVKYFWRNFTTVEQTGSTRQAGQASTKSQAPNSPSETSEMRAKLTAKSYPPSLKLRRTRKLKGIRDTEGEVRGEKWKIIACAFRRRVSMFWYVIVKSFTTLPYRRRERRRNAIFTNKYQPWRTGLFLRRLIPEGYIW